jgi:hypothetical protein
LKRVTGPRLGVGVAVPNYDGQQEQPRRHQGSAQTTPTLPPLLSIFLVIEDRY